mgnify:CR=1 FL=1
MLNDMSMHKLRSKIVLFHRSYKRFTGGHMKVLDYFQHTKITKGYDPSIYVTPDSIADHPWNREPSVVSCYDPEQADVLFVAGTDWSALSKYEKIEEKIPVINLIQGIRHAAPDTELYNYLDRKATRICVSDEVRRALEATQQCNGPLLTIQNGINLQALPRAKSLPEVDIFIAGVKQPQLAKVLDALLNSRGYKIDCQTEHIPRSKFLLRMASSRIVVALPVRMEGFFLPPLEAMAMGRTVVCPDCIGNRSFCIDGVTALMPKPDAQAIEEQIIRIDSDPSLEAQMRTNGKNISARFDLHAERAAFQKILKQVAK